MDANPMAILCYTDFARGEHANFTESRLSKYRPRRPGQTFIDLLHETFVIPSSALIRRSALSRVGLFNPDLRGGEDIDLWLRLARQGDFVFLDEIMVYKHEHASNLSKTLPFFRDQCKFLRWCQLRWGQEAEAGRLIHDKLAGACRDLAYHERVAGHLSEARRAYCDAALMGCQPVRSLAMAALLSLPTSVYRLVRKVSGAD